MISEFTEEDANSFREGACGSRGKMCCPSCRVSIRKAVGSKAVAPNQNTLAEAVPLASGALNAATVECVVNRVSYNTKLLAKCYQ